MNINCSDNQQRRLGIVAIILKSPKISADDFNHLLRDFSDLIVGRMGIPYRERGISIISLVVDGTNDQIGAMTGRIGQLPGVNVKSILTRI